MRGGQHFRVIGKAQIIVRAEIDHRPRLPCVIDHRARICGCEELRFIQFNRPRAKTNPVCKGRWSLQRVVAFARQKITQIKLCRVFVHQAIPCLRLPSLRTAHPSKVESFLWFTSFLTKLSAVIHTAEFRVGATNLAGFKFRTRLLLPLQQSRFSVIRVSTRAQRDYFRVVRNT